MKKNLHRLKYDKNHAIDTLFSVVSRLLVRRSTMTLLNAFLWVGACCSLARRLLRKHGHVLYRRMPPSSCWGWVALVSAHTLFFCHINLLLFKCCQPLVANYTPFVSVPDQCLQSGVRNPTFT